MSALVTLLMSLHAVQDFNKSTGSLSQTVFIPGSEHAVTGTSEGCAVVWACRSAEDGEGVWCVVWAVFLSDCVCSRWWQEAREVDEDP